MRRALLVLLMGGACVLGAVGALSAGEVWAEDIPPEAPASGEEGVPNPAPNPEEVQVSASDEAGEYAYDDIRIDEKLGDTVPEGITFRDEEGKPVELRSLITRPTAILLVYLRCPNVCSPLMREVAHTVDEVDMVAGTDFDLITVSFDARETPALAKRGKTNLLKGMKKEIPADSWRFLTGDGANIRKLCDSVGFLFKRDKDDYLHKSPMIFVTAEGKIVRYLYLGQQRTKENRNETVPALLPSDMKFAVNDARDGTARSFMQRMQRICYAYDPKGRSYVLNVNRIILFVTLAGIGLFLAILLIKRKKNPPPAATAQSVDDGAVGGGHA